MCLLHLTVAAFQVCHASQATANLQVHPNMKTYIRLAPELPFSAGLCCPCVLFLPPLHPPPPWGAASKYWDHTAGRGRPAFTQLFPLRTCADVPPMHLCLVPALTVSLPGYLNEPRQWCWGTALVFMGLDWFGIWRPFKKSLNAHFWIRIPRWSHWMSRERLLFLFLPLLAHVTHLQLE